MSKQEEVSRGDLIHLDREGTTRTACGRGGRNEEQVTTDPEAVTCRKCRMTVLYKVRSTATVTVTEPVDGTVKKKKRSRGSKKNRKRVTAEYQVTVDPRVMEAAKAICRPSQRLQIVSATEVRLVNR